MGYKKDDNYGEWYSEVCLLAYRWLGEVYLQVDLGAWWIGGCNVMMAVGNVVCCDS